MERIEEKPPQIESLGDLDTQAHPNKVATLPNLDKNSKTWSPSGDPKFNIEAQLFFKGLMNSSANKPAIKEDKQEIKENVEPSENKENQENKENKENQAPLDLRFPPGITIKNKAALLAQEGTGGSNVMLNKILE